MAFQGQMYMKSRCCNITTISRACKLSNSSRKHKTFTRRRVVACIEEKTAQIVSEPNRFDPNKSALCEGIKAVAVGKLGTKAVPSHILPLIDLELTQCDANSPDELLWQRASFLGSLFVKADLSHDEMNWLVRWCSNSEFASGRERHLGHLRITAGEVLASISQNKSQLHEFALSLLCDKRLNQDEAARLGSLLYSKNGDWSVKALIAHVMRVRHESESELAGLSIAAWRSVNDCFRKRQHSEHVYVLIAEPYDGTITWDLLTPLLGMHLHKRFGVRVVLGMGESGGPKYGPNLCDLIREMRVNVARNGEELENAFNNGAGIVAVHQRHASEGLHSWIKMRRAIVKRPCIASAEKFADVISERSDLFIGSAFHDSYVEKMAVAAEAIGYKWYIIMGRGMEGTIGVGVGEKRKTRLLTGWKKNDETYGREEVEYLAVEDGLESDLKATKGGAEALLNAKRLQKFMESGKSGEELFDKRANATLLAFDKGFDVLKRKGWIGYVV